MRAPSLLAQCLPGLIHNDKGSHSISTIYDRDVHFPSPAVEILPSKVQKQKMRAQALKNLPFCCLDQEETGNR